MSLVYLVYYIQICLQLAYQIYLVQNHCSILVTKMKTNSSLLSLYKYPFNYATLESIVALLHNAMLELRLFLAASLMEMSFGFSTRLNKVFFSSRQQMDQVRSSSLISCLNAVKL